MTSSSVIFPSMDEIKDSIFLKQHSRKMKDYCANRCFCTYQNHQVCFFSERVWAIKYYWYLFVLKINFLQKGWIRKLTKTAEALLAFCFVSFRKKQRGQLYTTFNTFLWKVMILLKSKCAELRRSLKTPFFNTVEMCWKVV